MTVLDYHSDLLANIGTLADSEGEFTSTAFTRFCTEILTEAGEFDDAFVLDFEGVGYRRRRLRVNGYDLSNPDNSVALIVSQYVGEAEISDIPAAEAKALLKALHNYLMESVEGTFLEDREESSAAYQLAYDLRNRGRNVSRFRLYFVTDARIKDVRGSLKELPMEEIDGIPIDFQLWDIERLHQLHESQSGREPLQIDLHNWVEEGIPALQVSSSGDFSTYLAAVPGHVLAALYAKYGNRLLESNVRSYLTNRGKVNKNIRETIYKSPQNFVAYNNGVTATAVSVTRDSSGNIVHIEDLQIVNGGQTTASLFYVEKEAKGPQILDDVFVQMKLVVVDPVVADELVPNISRYANSQNAVSAADFFSNSPYHKRLEDLSRRVLAPAAAGATYNTKWYYERTRGQYENDRNSLTRPLAARFEKMYPKLQKFDKPTLAKVIMSWEQKPHTVSAGAQKNFVAFADSVASAWEKDDTVFNEEYFKESVAKIVLYNAVRQRISEVQWYRENRGYLANIVAYTMAKLSSMIQEQGSGSVMNFDSIWRTQSVPDVVLNTAESAAIMVQSELVKGSRPVQNVTEWAKRPALWEKISSAPVSLSAPFLALLVDRSVVKEIKKAAKQTQKIDNGINAQMRVLEIPKDSWLELHGFATANRFASPDELSILDMMIGRRSGLPSERQAGRLLKLISNANAKGFVFSE